MPHPQYGFTQTPGIPGPLPNAPTGKAGLASGRWLTILAGIPVVWLLCFSCSPLPLPGHDQSPLTLPGVLDFETALPEAWHLETASASSISLQATPGGNSLAQSRSALVTVSPGDVANNGNRAELAVYDSGRYLDTMYYAWDFMIPMDDPVHGWEWQILAQWYQLPDFDRGETFEGQFPHPPVEIVLVPGNLQVKSSTTGDRVLATVEIRQGQWYRMAVGICFDTRASGWVEARIGSPGASLEAIGDGRWELPTLFNSAGTYFKLGLYRGFTSQTQASTTNRVWLDNVRLGQGWGEVAP